MTRYRAIDIIKNEIECVNRQDTCEHKCADCELVLPDIEIFEAYDMAIQALSQEPTFDDECQKDMDEAWEQIQKKRKRIPVTLDLTPCDDAISRKDAEQMFRNIRSHLKPQDYKSAEEFNTRDLMLLNAEQMIHALPFVTQKSSEDMPCITSEEMQKCKDIVKKYTPKQQRDDAISRQYLLDNCVVDKVTMPYVPVSKIENAPPVTQKSGKWIEHPEIETSTPEYLMFYECSECGDKQCFYKPDIHKKRFCSNCGARMVEPQERSE